MPSDPDVNFIEGLDDSEGVSEWRLSEPEPTTLIAYWPDEQPPTWTEIKAALENCLDEPILEIDELETDDPNVAWNVIVQWCSHNQPIILWVEPAQTLELEGPGVSIVDDCQWVVGFQTLLDVNESMTTYHELMRVVAGGLQDSPMVLDASTNLGFDRDQLHDLFLDETVQPSPEVLWITQLVYESGESPADSSCWIHTHGLNRCGLAELEMLEVPTSYASAAVHLINEMAEMFMEIQPPPAGKVFEIGAGLEVVMQPWREAAAYLNKDTPGNIEDRTGQSDSTDCGDSFESHVGLRAVVCGAQPQGQYRKLWVWPEQVLARLTNDEATIYRTPLATERAARQARTTWGQFATAFSTMKRKHQTPRVEDEDKGETTAFLISAGLPGSDNDDQSREHLWFRVLRFEKDRAEGELLNKPLFVNTIEPGDIRWIEQSDLSDWQVRLPDGIYGPRDVPEMWRAIDAIPNTESGS